VVSLLRDPRPVIRGMLMVQSSRLGRVRCVCFQLVAACSNSMCSRLESAKQLPRIVRRGGLAPFLRQGKRDADARRSAGPSGAQTTRFVSLQLEVCFRETLIAVLAPVRNFSVVCFVRVTSISVCEAEPVRNGLNRVYICDESRLRGLWALLLPPRLLVALAI
jgi:hypothetical protein